MLYVEISMCTVLLALCVIASYTDITKGVIKNKILLLFLCIGVVLDLVYYLVFAQDVWADFLINVAVITVVSLVLYFFHVWAGGDAKLAIVASLLIPARFYLVWNGEIYTVFLFIIAAFLFGFVYLMADAVYGALSGQSKFTKDDVLRMTKQFLRSYAISFLYVGLLNMLYVLVLARWIHIGALLLTVIYIVVAWVANSVKPLGKLWVLGILLVAFVTLSIVFKMIPFVSNYYGYIAIAILLPVKILMEARKYKTVPACDVKDGMILSQMSSAILMHARPNDFKTLSREDLRDRLTKEEAEVIRSLAAEGEYSVMIVRKIPFAVFLSLGLVVYTVLGGVL